MTFNDDQKLELIQEASLNGSSSRRERIAAHLLAAMIVGGQKGANELAIQSVQDRMIEVSLSLTDKLIVKLAENITEESEE